jgi:hypothetical protein
MWISMKARVISSAGVLLLFGACGDGAQGGGPAPAPPPDAGDHDNGSFEMADPIEVDAKGIFELVDGREDIDFYSFEGRQGEWVEIRSGSFDSFTFADTRLTLFDSKRAQLAYNERVESFPGEEVLARIVTRLPETGKYFIQVGDPEGPPFSAGLSQAYRLTVTELASAPDGFTVESDGDPATTPISFHRWNIDPEYIGDSFLVGTFSDASDVDQFSFTIAAGDRRALSAEVQDSGSLADGSTTSAGKVWVTGESGAVIARIDNSSGQSFLAPPLESGTYTIWVAHPESPVGTNDFYVVRATLQPENPPEADDPANGTIASAEPLTKTLALGREAAFLLAHLTDQDVDYFRFDGRVGQHASLYCDSAEGGSGLVGLNVSLRDETDSVLLEVTESPARPTAPGTAITLEQVAIPESGSIYVRTTKASQLPDVIGDWVRCAIYAR